MNIKNMYPEILFCLIGGWIMSACTEKQAKVAPAEVVFHGDTVTVESSSPVISKLQLKKVEKEPFCDEFRTVGTAGAENGHFAEVCAPFEGRITRAAVRLGDKVKAGQCLFEMSSPDFVEASKAYFQAVRNCEKAKADYDRKKVLMEHGITAQRELDEAYTEAENACREKESAEATLRIYQINPENLKMGQPLRVCSPIDGEVVANHITVGQYVKADDEAQATIADLRKVWVTALIKERYIGSVVPGGKAEVFTESEPDSVICGEVLNVGNLVDEETRSVQVVLACDNAQGKLKHGMYVSVHFISAPRQAIVLPSTAVFQGEQRSYVFVATGKENTYVRREVEVSTSSDNNQDVCIHRGLEAGETVISNGGIYLNE